MNRRPFVRALSAFAAIASAIVLSACNPENLPTDAKAMRPLSPRMIAEINEKNMALDSPVLVRIFKEESELEVWKEDKSGRFALLKTYPICRWSGELGPKIKEGDRQAPEGFYTITPGQMNPKSSYYLAFNMGYPNAYDRSWNRTGAELMIHGDCSSRGCYAMTDEQIGEIYALARDSFFGGQKAFQIQAFPFRMTAENMARHRKNPHMAFWKMLKQGYDHFEVTRLEPKVDVCERKYVFDAQPPANSSAAMRFQAASKCPAYEVNEDIVAAVFEKEQRDNQRIAELSAANVPTAPIKTGRDGGMNPVFLAALSPQQNPNPDSPIQTLSLASAAPGTLPAHVVPPGAAAEAAAQAAAEKAAAAERAAAEKAAAEKAAADAAAQRNQTRVAAPAQNSGVSGFFNRMTQMIGLGSSSSVPASQAAPAPAKSAPPARVANARPTTPAPKADNRPRQQVATPQPPAEPAIRPPAAVQAAPAAPVQTATPAAPARPTPPKPQPLEEPARAAAPPASAMAGASPVLPSSNFESRFGAFR